jgi:hypothetical protein
MGSPRWRNGSMCARCGGWAPASDFEPACACPEVVDSVSAIWSFQEASAALAKIIAERDAREAC